MGGIGKIIWRENRSNTGNVRNTAIKMQAKEERPINVTDEWPEEWTLQQEGWSFNKKTHTLPHVLMPLRKPHAVLYEQ